MKHELDFQHAPSNAIEVELGKRLDQIRLHQNVTQAQLAYEAGVSRNTVARLGKEDAGISLDSFIRIIQGLGLTDSLQNMLLQPAISPLAQLEAQKQEKAQTRQRASGKRGDDAKWTWDEGDNS